MDIIQENNLNQEKDYINKGIRVLPDLKTAIFANIKGFVNGSYPEPLTGAAKKLGYYPISMATDQEMEQIEIIEKQTLGKK